MPILCSVKVQFVVSPWWAQSSLVIDAPRFNKQIQTQICWNCHFPWFLFPSRNNQLYSFSKGSVEPIIDYGSPVTSFHLADSSVTFPPAKGAMQLNRHLHAKFKEKREIKKKTRTNSGAKLNKKLTLTNKRSEAHTGRIRDTTSGPKLQSIWKCIELSWGVGSEGSGKTNECVPAKCT